jgi:hypothetical protein
MTVDYLVSSLPTLVFGAAPAIDQARFDELTGGVTPPPAWEDLETQLRNALAEARGGGERSRRPARGCSLYWKKRVFDAFAEKDVARRDELLDRVWWEAAGELADPADPLGRGALAAYAVRLKIALRRARISSAAGAAAFDRLTAETKWSPGG